jgi:Malectin domain/F5/8 type C domain/Abnormal spindle-like microcephaly-assoc'd, ASPM-SPD-2-Hydin
MSKGQLRGSIRGVGAVSALSLAAAVAWVGCNQWQGVEMTESNLVSPNGAITQGGDEMRTNWFPDQPGLDPAIVAGPNFKQLFKTALASTTEKVLAQPLVVNGKVLIASEDNNLYLLDAVTGAITASRQLGAGYDASGALGCGDISPRVGITGTPVIDTSSNTAYFFSKSSGGVYTLHAVDAGSLAEKGGFPVTISGTAQNDGTKTFDSTHAHQRPGLLLMGGVVYGAFASHCDHSPYVGWIIGVTTAGVIKTRFATSAGTGSGDGIWMSGSGLSSDGAGNILFATGNPQGQSPAFPATIASNTPPANLDESAARVVLQADGSLKTTDFFAPFNAQSMGDDDLAGGGIISLPSQFGTAAVPRTAVIVGKAGLFYLLNRDKLGGFKKGTGNGNDVLTEINLNGGTWGHPAAWPGDGGYVAVTTNGGANAQTGYRLQLLKYAVNGANPSFTVVGYATSPTGVVNNAGGPPIDNFGAYAGSPSVTSNGTNAGSAVFWAVGGGNLRAYKLQNNMLVSILSKSIGASAKFQTVGIGAGRVYVGTADGNVFGFGAGSAAVTGASVAFGTVTVGQQKTLTATITANQNLTIPAGGLTISPSTFTLGASTPALPATLTSGQSLTVPVTFKPTAAGALSGSINVTIQGGGGGSVSLSGTGQVTAAQLNITPATIAFGGITTGTTKQISVLIQNTGNQTLTFAASTLPGAPFSVTGVPANGATLAAGANVTATATFAPTTAGTFSGSLVVNSNGGNLTVPLTGASGTAGHLVITPLSIDFGTTTSGVSVTKSFTVANTGGTDLQITKSKPPALGQFVATTTLGEGSALLAGQTLTETVKFTSTAGGTFNDVWTITSNETGTTATNVAFTGTVSGGPLSRTGWIATWSGTGGDPTANALDGSLASRWSSGAAMAAGMWFQVDMGTANTVSQIVMDSNGSGDYARAYSVYVTNDTANLGTAVFTGTAAATPVTASFTAKSGRFIRVVLGTVPTGVTSWWSIHEFNAYGTGGGGGGGGSGGAGSGGGGSGGGGAGGSGGGTVLINAGGPAVSPYAADVSFTGGGTINHANTIDVSGVTNPAPAAVYQSARTGNFTYTIGGFTAGSNHTVRLHMCETFFNTTGSRTFNVTLNGTQVLTAFDIRAQAGAQNKAIVQQFTSTANASGQYVIQFTTVVNAGLVSGIQIQ